VCGDEVEVVDINQVRDIDACRKETLADAVYNVDHPLVTQAYESHHPGQLFATAPARHAPAGAI
jgi:hypothetical protein